MKVPLVGGPQDGAEVILDRDEATRNGLEFMINGERYRLEATKLGSSFDGPEAGRGPQLVHQPQVTQ